MSEKNSFYITTTLPYVNAEPHIGHAMELIHADVIARWKKIQGHEVFFNTGTDEHGQKVWQKAQEEGRDVQEYADGHANKFRDLIKLLGISDEVHFIRTTDDVHKQSAQEFWQRCEKAGDIYKQNYQTKYCVGCELEKTDSELEDGHCIIHPKQELEIREEENYFFRFSKYEKPLLALYDRGLILPDFRANEMRELIKRGLDDFSISRLKDKMPWGVPVPGDDKHVMYVWFDALVNYISTLGWPDDDKFNRFWADGLTVQYAGKDQVRQQSAMWQAMLLSVGLPTTNKIVIHGFLNISGEKMSKSVGNVISPQNMIDRYGTDATRAMLSGVNQFEDTDVNIGVPEEGFDLAYRSNLQDGLGNLVARIMKLSEEYVTTASDPAEFAVYPEVSKALDDYKLQEALSLIMDQTRKLDGRIQSEKPWETKDTQAIYDLRQELGRIAISLEPFMPSTSTKILESIKENKKPDNLFPRL